MQFIFLLSYLLSAIFSVFSKKQPVKNMKTLTEKQSKMIEDLAVELRPIVESIESAIKTSQNQYARYGSILARLSGGDAVKAQILFLALQKAGANAQGLRDGYTHFV